MVSTVSGTNVISFFAKLEEHNAHVLTAVEAQKHLVDQPQFLHLVANDAEVTAQGVVCIAIPSRRRLNHSLARGQRAAVDMGRQGFYGFVPSLSLKRDRV